MIKCDVLLTYAWVRSSYSALRSLTRLGLKVAVADTGRVGMGQWSRFSHFAGRYAPPLTAPDQFIADVTTLLNKTGAHFLLPGHDETEVLARHRGSLPDNVLFPVTTYDNIHRANDKGWMAQFAREHNVPVPRVLMWDSLPDLESKLAHNTGPYVVKLRRGNSAKGVFYPESGKATLSLCRELCENYDLAADRYPVVQERISGDGWGVSCLYWHGERIASFTHQRLREKTATGGTSTLRESIRNPLLESYAHKLLDSMNWHGLAMVEFKYDSVNQLGWFIEINPRLWGSLHLAIESGVDFPALLYIASTKGAAAARARVRDQREGVIARWFLGDVILAASELAQLHPAKALRLVMPGNENTLDDWRWDDPMAFVGQASCYLSNFVKYRSLNPVQEGMLG